MEKKLKISKTDKIIFGVCGGLGEYFEVDSKVFRLAFLIAFLIYGAGFWIYIFLGIFMTYCGEEE